MCLVCKIDEERYHDEPYASWLEFASPKTTEELLSAMSARTPAFGAAATRLQVGCSGQVSVEARQLRRESVPFARSGVPILGTR